MVSQSPIVNFAEIARNVTRQLASNQADAVSVTP